jgi:V/A-type H+-transporting ATPase subunit E
MDQKTGISAIAREVIDEVQKEAETTIIDAQNQAKETLRLANKKAQETYHTIIVDAKKQADAQKHKSVSTAEVEMRNRLLQVKEDLVDAVLDRAVVELEDFTKTPKYQNYILRLITTTAEKMAQPDLIVYVNTKDKGWLTKDLLNPISKEYNTELQLAPTQLNIIGGCKIQTKDGKITYDATLDSHLQELKPTLRNQIITQLGVA